VGGELDLLVPPLGRPVHAGDDAHAVDTPEVPVDERVPGLGLVGGTVGEPEMPPGVLFPGMMLQEGVLLADLGWIFPQSLSSTYWRLSISCSACLTASGFTE